MGNRRIDYIDLAKGFGIICIVAVPSGFNCHVFGSLMPMFFVLSGMVFKKYDNYKIFIKRKVKSLLIPFLFFYFFLWISSLAINIVKSGLIDLESHSFVGDLLTGIYLNGPIWFVICVFWCNILYYLVSVIKNEYLKILAVLTITGLGLSLSHFEINNCLDIISACMAIPFFFVGVLFREYDLFSMRFFSVKYSFILGIFIILFEYIISCYSPEFDYSFWIAKASGSYIMFYVLCFLQVIGIILICKNIKMLPLISYCGRNSLIILGVHGLFCYLCYHRERWFGNEWYYDYLQFACCMIFSLLCIPLLKRFYPFFVGVNK